MSELGRKPVPAPVTPTSLINLSLPLDPPP